MRKRLALLLVLILALTGLWQRQFLLDRWRLYGYTPAPSIVQLADDTTMTPAARRLFYVNHPELEDRQAFASACANQDEQTIVLGCYHPIDRGIYVFHVSDTRLSGVDQVTAAHELLHAAYDRLSASERKYIDTLLQQQYAKLTDDRLKKVFASYQQSEPDDVVNEMHSIFGTEVKDLPPELEQYYSRYFADRSKITTYAARYQGEFSSRQAAVKQDDAKLDSLKTQIDSNTSTFKQQQATLLARRDQLNAQRSSDADAYNRSVSSFNQSVDAYNALSRQTQQLIEQYNQLVTVRNEIALEVTQLADSINSNAPATIN